MVLAGEPERAHRFLDKLMEMHLRNLERFLSAVGEFIDVILFGDDLGMQSGPQVSPAMYREYFQPRERAMWQLVRQRAPHLKIMLHCCGGVRELLPGLIDAGLDAINISVDAAGKEVFEATRVFLDYDTVVTNIRTLVRLRQASGRTHPKLILSFVRRDNSADEQAFIAEWSRIADKIHVTDLHNWGGTLNVKRDAKFPCYRLWLTFTVLWDGRVSMCCADFDGRHIFGDLRTQTIAEVWNSPLYRAARRQHLESGGPAICRSCDLPKKDSPMWVTKLV